MQRFRRIAAPAVIVLVGSLVSVSQASAEPAQSSVRDFTYITYRAPAPPLAECDGPFDNPTAVVISMVEGGEMGGVVAAPLGRQALEVVLGK